MSQGLVDTIREHNLFRQGAHFLDLITIQRKNVSKRSDRKGKKIARLVFHLTEIRNVRLGNVIYADLKITLLQNVPSHQKIMRNDASQYVLMKKLIVHATTAKMKMTIRYTHLWHEFLVMTNTKVKTMVTVYN